MCGLGIYVNSLERCFRHVPQLAGGGLGIPLEEVTGERAVWASLLRLLLPTQDKWWKMDGWMAHSLGL